MEHLSFLSQLRFLERRLEPVEGFGWRVLLIVLSVLVAFAIGIVFFVPFGVSAYDAYSTLLVAGFGDRNGLAFTLVQASPLLMVGLGTVIAFRCGFRYLGFEGTMNIGAIVGIWFALACGEEGLFGPLPPLVFFPLVFLICFVAGGIWVGIVGFSKAKLGGNEVIVSLMSNYVAILLVNFLVSGPLRQPGDQPQTPHIPGGTRLPFIIPGTRAHAGILVAVALMIVTFIFLRRTPLGYKLMVSGDSPKAARYGGIDVARMIILAAFLGGGLAGVAGGFEVLGVHFRVTEGITSDLGRLGIIVALLASLNPFGTALMAIFYAGIGIGADAMQRRMGVPTPVVYTIQTLVVMVMLVMDTLRVYRLVWPWQRAAVKVEVEE